MAYSALPPSSPSSASSPAGLSRGLQRAPRGSAGRAGQPGWLVGIVSGQGRAGRSSPGRRPVSAFERAFEDILQMRWDRRTAIYSTYIRYIRTVHTYVHTYIIHYTYIHIYILYINVLPFAFSPQRAMLARCRGAIGRRKVSRSTCRVWMGRNTAENHIDTWIH